MARTHWARSQIQSQCGKRHHIVVSGDDDDDDGDKEEEEGEGEKKEKEERTRQIT